jgi:DNA polymerase-3 subunit gamma/tau
MTYQVLARKWRPRDFSQMVGQSHVLRALVNALATQRLHHAYLFTGTRGVGKTSLARIFAKSLNCETGITSTPCGQCSACREVDEGRFVDLIEVDAASRTKVDDTRDLLENVAYAPARGRFKVYLIDEVHMFSGHSFNALLKTLEEPPPHVKFLLATTDPKKLPITILSRCLQFNLKRLGADQIGDQLRRILEAEGIPAPAETLRLIATAADGSMRDSLSLLDQAIAYTNASLDPHEVAAMLGTVASEQVLPLVEALCHGRGAELLSRARALAEFAPDHAQILGEMLSILRRIAVCQVLGADATVLDEAPEVLALAAGVSPEDCQLFYQLGLLARRDLPLAPEPQVGFEMALLRMLAFHPETVGASPSAIASVRPASSGAASTSAANNVEPARPRPAPAPGMDAPAMPSSAAKPVPPPPAVEPPAPVSRTHSPTVPAGDAAPATPLDWAALVGRLETTGLVREFARHCALVRVEGELVELGLTPQSENLRGERQVKGLEQALVRALGHPVTLRFVRANAGTARSPAQVLSEAETARQAAATRLIEADPQVQALQQRFGAVIEEIRPADE